MNRLLVAVASALAAALPLSAAEPIKVLIVDGQNNHNWRAPTPILKQILEEAKIFSADLANAPERPRAQKGKDVSNEVAEYKKQFAACRPKFKDYQVVVSNYNGELWPEQTRSDFVEFITHGGGFVAVHAADNAFPEWPEYNAMIGVGGWGGRNEKSG